MPSVTTDRTRQQLPVHRELREIARGLPITQRWNAGRHSWARTCEPGGFDRRRYTVERLDEATAKQYVVDNHYSRSYPAARFRYGLYLQEPAGPALVGVAIFGVPMRASVLTKPLPDLRAFYQSIELQRLVIEGDRLADSGPGGRAPANSESFFIARCLEDLAGLGIVAVLAFSDPVARIVAGRTLFPGHYGIIYQASNAVFCGRSSRRCLTVLPDGSTLTDRAIQKVRGQERGHEYVERRLISLGAPARMGGAANAGAWLMQALEDVKATRLSHPGNLRYVLPVGARARKSLRIVGADSPYPKPWHD